MEEKVYDTDMKCTENKKKNGRYKSTILIITLSLKE